jgi:hypothetical protein
VPNFVPESPTRVLASEPRRRVAVVQDYAPSVSRVLDYLDAEMNAASPAAVVAYCETGSGEVVELSLSDLVSTAHLAAWAVQRDLDQS